MQTPLNAALTPDLLRKLAQATGPCITVALQGDGNSRARFTDALRKVEGAFKAQNTVVPDEFATEFRRLENKLRDEARPANEATGTPAGIIMLSSPGNLYMFEADETVRDLVETGDTFNLRPVLSLISRKADFYILALNQNHPRLIHCTESTSGEVGLPPSIPKNYLEFRETRQPDHTLDGRSAGGPSTGHMKGVLFGTSSDSDNKDEYHHDYYRAIDRGITTMLNGTSAPLVVVAVEHELALYRSLNTYPHFVEPGVHGAPDGLKGGEMHKRALELLASYQPDGIRKQLEQFEKLAGTGHASSHAQEIVRAAFEGRIAHLFLQESAEYMGIYDAARDRLTHHENGIVPLRDLINDAIVQTLRHGGGATMLRAEEMPHGVPVCAVFRYPSTGLPAATQAGTKNNGEQTAQ